MKLLYIFYTVDTFYNKFEKFTQTFRLENLPKKNKNKMSNSNVITIMILFQLSGF